MTELDRLPGDKKLDALQYAHWLECWKELDKAKSLNDYNRRAKAQECLTEALFLRNQLPRWFTDPEWELQFKQLHKQLYTGVN